MFMAFISCTGIRRIVRPGLSERNPIQQQNY